jgi:antitoxin ParD1/3/4
MNISLTPDLDNWVAEQVKTGSYLSATELICEALRLLKNYEVIQQNFVDELKKSDKTDIIPLNQQVNSTEEKLYLLRAKLQAGENSPLVKDFNAKDFISGLHRKYAQ